MSRVTFNLRDATVESVATHLEKRAHAIKEVSRDEFMTAVVARMLESLILGGVDYRNADALNFIIGGNRAGPIGGVNVLRTGADDDDIPF